MLYGIKAVTTSDARFTWVPAEFLAEKQVRAWSDMPVWVPPTGRTAGFARVICQKAYDAGLTFRPLADTAKDTLTWYHSRPAAEQEKARAGLAPDKEKAVLAEWHAKQGRSEHPARGSRSRCAFSCLAGPATSARTSSSTRSRVATRSRCSIAARPRPGCFPKVEKLVGDRNQPDGHAALKGRTWDVVYDIPTGKPKWIVDAAAVLKGNVGQYVFVSSTAAYKDFTASYPDRGVSGAGPCPH